MRARVWEENEGSILLAFFFISLATIPSLYSHDDTTITPLIAKLCYTQLWCVRAIRDFSFVFLWVMGEETNFFFLSIFLFVHVLWFFVCTTHNRSIDEWDDIVKRNNNSFFFFSFFPSFRIPTIRVKARKKDEAKKVILTIEIFY